MKYFLSLATKTGLSKLMELCVFALSGVLHILRCCELHRDTSTSH